MKEIRADIKSQSFKRLYLLYGDERFLVERYEKNISEAVLDPSMRLMNLDVFAGKDCSVDGIINAAETAAFMSERRLVVLKDTGLFAAGRKDDSEKLAGFLADIPETTVMLISESNVDKRGRLYKKAAAAGRAVEFKRPSENELLDWVYRSFAKEGKEITPDTARRLLRVGTGDMQSLHNEIQKLTAYQEGRVIEAGDIEAVCVKSPDSRIFELVAAVGNKNPRRALDIFNNMLLLKESPIMVLTMIARQLRLILQCKYLHERGASPGEIASELSLRSYFIDEYLKQGRNFTTDGLITALKRVLDADVDIKTGRLNDKLAVEKLIAELT